MYCSNCGTKVDDQANHCYNCGAKLIRPETIEKRVEQTAEKVEQTTAKIENTEKESAKTEAKTEAKAEPKTEVKTEPKTEAKQEEPAKKTAPEKDAPSGRKFSIPMILGAAAIVIVVFLLIQLIGGPTKIDVMDYTGLTYSGLNTETRAYPTFDRDTFLADLKKKKTLTTREEDEIYTLLNDIEKDYALSKESDLSNGDKVKITSNVKKDKLSAYGVKLKNGSKKIKVEGRIEITEVPMDDYFYVKGKGFEGYGSASLKLDKERFVNDISEIILNVDDSDTARSYVENELIYMADNMFSADLSDCYDLSNGDEVEIPLKLYETEIYSYGIRFTLENDIFKGTVNDLFEFIEIKLEDYLDVEYTSDRNYNGTASIYTSPQIDRERLTEDLAAAFEEQNRSSFGEAYEGTNFYSEAKSAVDTIYYDMDDGYDIDSEVSKSEMLSNGDVITLSWKFEDYEDSEDNSRTFSGLGIKVLGGETEVEITGLYEFTEIKIADYLGIEYTSDSKYTGVASISSSPKIDWQRLTEDLATIFKEQNRGAYSSAYEGMDFYDEAEDAVNDIGRSINNAKADVSKSEMLSNGEVITLSWIFEDSDDNSMTYPGLGIKVLGGEIEAEVTGLSEFIEIKMADYLGVEYQSDTNYNGGTSIHTYPKVDWERLTEDLAGIFEEENRGVFESAYEGMNFYEESEFAMVDIEVSSDYAKTDVSKSEMLSNGDVIRLSWKYEDSDDNCITFSDMGIKVFGGETEIEITGLLEPRNIDLTDAVQVTVSGIEPNFVVEYTVNTEKEYYAITGLRDFPSREEMNGRIGDTITREITFDKKELLVNGYIVTNNAINIKLDAQMTHLLSFESLDDEILLPIETECIDQLKKKAVDFGTGIVNEANFSNIIWTDADYHTEKIVNGLVHDGNFDNYITYVVSHAAIPALNQNMDVSFRDLYMVRCYTDLVQNVETKELVYNDCYDEFFYSAKEAENYIKKEMGFESFENSSIEEIVSDNLAGDMWGAESHLTMNLTGAAEPVLKMKKLKEVKGEDPLAEPLQTGKIDAKAAAQAAVTIEYDHHIYARYDAEFSWDVAESYCEAAGGHLATVTSATENAIVTKLLENARYSGYWLGATDAAFEGGWTWVTGERMTYRNWNKGEPNNSLQGEEYENYMSFGSAYDYHWNDSVGAVAETGFILEIDPIQEETDWPYTESTYLNSIDRVENYNYDVRTGYYNIDQNGGEHFASILLSAGDRQTVQYELNGEWSVLSADLSTVADVDDNANMCIVIWGDDTILYSNYNYTKKDSPEDFCIDVSGVQRLFIQTRDINKAGGWIMLNEAKLYKTGEEKELRSSYVTLVDLTEASADSEWGYLRKVPGGLAGAENCEGYNKKGLVTLNGRFIKDYIDFAASNSAWAEWKLDGAYTSISGYIEAGRETYEGSNDAASYTVNVEINADGKIAFQAENISCSQGMIPFEADLTGVQTLKIRTSTNKAEGAATLSFENTNLTTAEKILTNKEQYRFPDMTSGPAAFAADSRVCGDRCYYRFDQAMTLNQAKNFCKAAGGRLAMPKNEEQNQAVAQLSGGGIYDYYWLGGALVDGFWMWDDNETFGAYQNWGNNQPDNYDGIENQLSIHKNGTWNDFAPDNLVGFIMEIQAS